MPFFLCFLFSSQEFRLRRRTHWSEWLGILKSVMVWGGAAVACKFVLVLQHSHFAPTRLPRLVRLMSSRPSPRDSRSLLLLPASARQTGATCDVTNVSLDYISKYVAVKLQWCYWRHGSWCEHYSPQQGFVEHRRGTSRYDAALQVQVIFSPFWSVDVSQSRVIIMKVCVLRLPIIGTSSRVWVTWRRRSWSTARSS